MMYNTQYLPENFEQCRLEKTILQHCPNNFSVRSSWVPRWWKKTMKRLMTDHLHQGLK